MNKEQSEAIIVSVVIDDSNAEKEAGEFASSVQKGLKKYIGTYKLIDFKNISEEGGNALSGLVGDFGRLGLAAAAAAAVGITTQKAFDFALQGEQVRAVNAQFDNLAKNAGLVPDLLRKGLKESSDGLANMETLLGKANSAILNLGSSASRLPEVLDLSRKVAANLGGSIEDRFTGLVSAIEAGNTKALKAQGIYLDTDEALRNYAKGLGLAAGDLDQSQRAQAVLNAVLDQGAKQYKNVNTEITPLTDNVNRLKTAFGDLSDEVATSVADSGFFQSITKNLADFARSDGLKRGVKEFTNNFSSMMGEAVLTGNPFSAFINNFTKSSIVSYKQSGEAIAEIKKEAQAAKSSADEALNAEKKKITEKQRALILSRELGLQDIKNQANLARVNLQLSGTNTIESVYERNLAQQALFGEKSLVLKTNYENRLAQIDAEKKADGLQTEQEYQAKRLQAANTYALGVAEIGNQQALLSQNLTDSISDGSYMIDSLFGDLSDEAKNYQLSVEQAAKGINTALKGIAKEAVNSLGNGVGKGFAAFGETLVNGGNSFDAFTNAFLKSVGEMAVASGTRFIMEGLAWMFVPGFEGTGSAMMAAGAALATFGGALGAVMANSAPNKGGSSGGGVDSTDTGTTSVVDPENLKRADVKQGINIIIQGDVFDSPDTGMRIADILNNEFDMRGVQIGGV